MISLQAHNIFRMSKIHKSIGNYVILPFIDIYAGALVYLSLITISFNGNTEHSKWSEWLDHFTRLESDFQKDHLTDFILKLMDTRGDNRSKTKKSKRQWNKHANVMDRLIKIIAPVYERKNMESPNLTWTGRYHLLSDITFHSKRSDLMDAIPQKVNLKSVINPTHQGKESSGTLRSKTRWEHFKKRQPTENGYEYHQFIIRKCCWIFNTDDYHGGRKKSRLSRDDLSDIFPRYQLFNLISTAMCLKPYEFAPFIAVLSDIENAEDSDS